MQNLKYWPKPASIFLLFFITVSGFGCKKEGESSLNPEIERLLYCCEEDAITLHQYSFVSFVGNKIFTKSGWQIFDFDSTLKITGTGAFDALINSYIKQMGFTNTGGNLCFYPNNAGTKLLFSVGGEPYVAAGGLFEVDLRDSSFVQLVDGSHNISTTYYFHGDDSKLVFYSYGNNSIDFRPGYYVLDITSGVKTLIFPYMPAIGTNELVRGFDLSKDNKKILHGIVNLETEDGSAPRPQIGLIDIETKQQEMLPIEFDPGRMRICLWVQFSPDEKSILYSQFPAWATGTVTDYSEMGIIDRTSGKRRVLDANTNAYGYSVQIAPVWTEDGKHIIYGSGRILSGGVGRYSLYVLKNVTNQ